MYKEKLISSNNISLTIFSSSADKITMKFFKVVLVVALAAFANAAAVPNPEAALDTNPLEKRCRSSMLLS